MTQDEITDFIMRLHDEGYAVVVFTPDELGNAEYDHIEDVMTERGWETISMCNGE